MRLSWQSISFQVFALDFKLFALNFNFLHCLGLINMLSANQHGEIFVCILLRLVIGFTSRAISVFRVKFDAEFPRQAMNCPI